MPSSKCKSGTAEPRLLPLAIAICTCLLFILPWTASPSLNLEFLFVDAANSLFAEAPAETTYRNYFSNQANPLGTSFVAHITHELLPSLSDLTAARLQSVFGLLLIIVSGWFGFRGHRANSNRYYFWALTTVFNPLVATAATRVTADLLPSAIVFTAFIVACSATQRRSNASAAIVPALLLIGTTLKYNLVYFLGSLVPLTTQYEKDSTRRRVIRRVLAISVGFLFGLAILTAMLVWQATTYGVLFLDDDLRLRHGLQLTTPYANLARGTRYLIFLSLMISPVLLLSIRRFLETCRWAWLTLPTGLLLFGLAQREDPTGGELDFGGLVGEFWLFESVLIFIGSLLVPVLFHAFFSDRNDTRRLNLVMFVAIPLMVMSFARPAQRYLIPLILITSFVLLTSRIETRPSNQFVIPLIFLMFMSTQIFLAHQRGTAIAADRMAKYVQDHSLLNETLPGTVGAHAGQYWSGYFPTLPNFKIVSQHPGEFCMMHSESVTILGLPVRTFCLTRNL